MANVIVNDTNLTNIANAIREKNGETTTYKPSEMAAAIQAITVGGSDFGEMQFAEISATNNYSNYAMPDLSPYISDFSQIVAMFWACTGGAYVYLRGVNPVEETPYKVFYLRGYTSTSVSYFHRTPYTDSYYYLSGEVAAPKIMGHDSSASDFLNDQEQNLPFQYKLFVYYEEAK